VASSDATNMQASAVVEGDEVVINARKWWATGIGHPNTAIAIVMARTPDAARDRHHQHSMVLVPMDTPGVRIRRMLSVFGGYHEPHGHGEVHFDNVRVSASNLIRGPGAGFEIAQGRLGPGRIHHCMRCIGSAEHALELAIARGRRRIAFGKPIIDLGGNRERIAEARMAIDQARLLTLYAAWKMDNVGTHAAMSEIAAIKVIAPRLLARVVDDAIQLHGGAGICQDTMLPALFAHGRMLRIADGPDEVHKAQIAKAEIERQRSLSH
jgi:alkylation response protein AidB-like acyl-CoA dehydrogenase